MNCGAKAAEAAALQNLAGISTLRRARSVLDCGGPPPLSFRSTRQQPAQGFNSLTFPFDKCQWPFQIPGMVAVNSTMLALGTAAPDFKLPDTNGKSVSPADFKGRPLL